MYSSYDKYQLTKIINFFDHIIQLPNDVLNIYAIDKKQRIKNHIAVTKIVEGRAVCFVDFVWVKDMVKMLLKLY